MTRPSEFCDATELTNLGNLYAAHFGDEESATRAARLGVFSHHGNTPQGIRLSVEVAMKENLARFVICTSTLAQGVNLPLRYLIVSGTMQGTDRIKGRDFHNLIGRAGRAGMHTEGTIIFSDPDLYDLKASSRDQWRWREAIKTTEPKRRRTYDQLPSGTSIAVPESEGRQSPSDGHEPSTSRHAPKPRGAESNACTSSGGLQATSFHREGIA